MSRSMRVLVTSAALVAAGSLVAGAATAQTTPETPAAEAPAAEAPAAEASYTLAGYAEAYYEWNVTDPSNGITNLRGFDNRHNSFTLSNLAIDLSWDDQHLVGRVALQVGHTPSTYYLGEPSLPGSGGANATGPELWKYVQQAFAGIRLSNGLLMTAGVYLSPVGPEGIAVKDNWNWSRSNLFFGLPFYHTGVKLSYPLTSTWTLMLHVCNGWNSVVDNNDAKSVALHAAYASQALSLNALYFGGIERPSGAPEGDAWRHLVDVNATWTASPRLALLGQVDAGVEPNDIGTSSWFAAAGSARVTLTPTLFAAARGDFFLEHAPDGASRIFWPVDWVASGTATLDWRPRDRASLRVEYRHDHADGDIYFGGDVTGDGVTTPFVPNRSSQDTFTVGLTTWL